MLRARLLPLAPLLAGATSFAPHAPPQQLEVTLDYAAEHPNQVVELLVPPGSGELLPVVLWRAGGWGGPPSDVDSGVGAAVAAAANAAGVALALPGLRESPTDPFPTPTVDLARAIQYLRSVAPEYGLDPERIFCLGRSSGGTFAATLAYGPDIAGWFPGDAYSAHSSRPNGVCLGSAGYSFNALHPDLAAPYFGFSTFGELAPELLELASPGTWLEASTGEPVPTYLIYKGPIGTPPLANKHDSWHGFQYWLSLVEHGVEPGVQYFPSGDDGTADYTAVIDFLLAQTE